MYESALNILEILNDKGFEAYIVGGYPRDRYLGIESTDIDICTSASPEQTSKLFDMVDMSYASYGSVRLTYQNFLYEVTTFRRDKSLMDGNRSYMVEYVDTLEEDLKRRDFIINTLCINQFGEYVDCMQAREDMDKKIIRSVKNPMISFSEDPLRMLRAVRFATCLSFDLSDDIVSAIMEKVSLLTNLSFFRRKQELNFIFSNVNLMKGITYIIKFHMNQFLGIDVTDVTYCANPLGIWAQCTYDDRYPFTKQEKKTIESIRTVLSLTPSSDVMHQYGEFVCNIVDEIRGKKEYYELQRDYSDLKG